MLRMQPQDIFVLVCYVYCVVVIWLERCMRVLVLYIFCFSSSLRFRWFFIKGTGDVTNFDILDSRDQDITNAIISKTTPPATSLDAETGKYSTHFHPSAIWSAIHLRTQQSMPCSFNFGAYGTACTRVRNALRTYTKYRMRELWMAAATD